jgi:hypothetical protein
VLLKRDTAFQCSAQLRGAHNKMVAHLTPAQLKKGDLRLGR